MPMEEKKKRPTPGPSRAGGERKRKPILRESSLL